MKPSPQSFNNVVLLLVILYSVQRCINHRLDLGQSSTVSLYSLVCDVPLIAPIMASAALY